MKPNLGFYVQKINDIVTETEAIGDKLNPFFVDVRTSLDNNEELSSERLTEVHTNFSAGAARYEEMLATITTLKAPVKVIGIHKKLEKAYTSYVAACKDMVDSIDAPAGKVDREKFDDSEKEQDETTDVIAFCIQRMTSLLLK